MNDIIPIEVIQQKIFLIRGHKVMLDTDLANLYGVTVKRLNEQVKRNVNRFPQDFMFQLSEEEYQFLRSHFATLKIGRVITGNIYLMYLQNMGQLCLLMY